MDSNPVTFLVAISFVFFNMHGKFVLGNSHLLAHSTHGCLEFFFLFFLYVGTHPSDRQVCLMGVIDIGFVASICVWTVMLDILSYI